MSGLTNACDAESTTTSSATGNGVPTPISDTASLADHSAMDGWLDKLSDDHPQAPGDGQGSSTALFGSLRVTRTSHPMADSTFLIIDKSQNRALVCHNGHLHFEDIDAVNFDKPISGHWQWLCTERNGFKGFQNVAELGFLGHDLWWDFYAKSHRHEGWESFTVNRREGNYYWIQALKWWTHWQLSARADGSGLFAERDGGTLWEFVELHL
ncbi:hypothetical protein VB005_03598 [Metarhizium brunneum]